MGVLWPDWSQLHQKKSFGLLWSPLLAFFSLLYGGGICFRLSAYNRRLFKRKRLPGFVISIGNLTAGGTGKTPAAVMLAKWASKNGYRVAVLSRGYGGHYKTKILEVSDGSRIKADPQETGDEPYLLAKKLSGVPIVISRKRHTAGLFAHDKFGTDFFILDDGFQHLGLKRDLDLALIDATCPFGNGHLLPWGPLREPVDQLARADAFILTRVSQSGSGGRALEFLKGKFPATPIFYGDHLPDKVVFPHSNDVYEPEVLKGKRVLAFAGIARPEAFRQTLIRLGADPVHFKGFRDHYRFDQDEVRALIRMKEKIGAHYILTTEKDWVRMSSFDSAWNGIGYLCVEFALISGHRDFFQMINSKLSNRLRVL